MSYPPDSKTSQKAPDIVPSAGGEVVPTGEGVRYLDPLLSTKLRRKYIFCFAIWGALALFFWQWWLRPEHILGIGRYVLLTLALGWLFFLQLYFVALFFRSRVPARDAVAMGPQRVAMIVTKTPSEPLEVLKRTLRAMLDQDVPHDTWLADEDPRPETVEWCMRHGVKIATRKDCADYHRPQWPRRTRCKEGNLAYFYDHCGYENYDFVSQLDADHVPTPGYLREILKPFANPAVGYVSAPSICSSNAEQSWAARSRLHTEAMFHGVLQAGYNNGFAPMCIGSHYAVRTSALKAVGGLGPELAEDHSTSMILNAGGWRGVHAIDAIAIGDGPGTFSDMITQEFQWSRSLVTLLLQYTPNYIGKLPLRLKFQFLFSQLLYPIFALFMAFTFLLPLTALVFDMRYADVTYPAFVGHMLPSAFLLIALVFEIRRDGLFRPHDARIMSWEKALFETAKWPWVMWGCLMAVRDHLTGNIAEFRITPKGAAVQSTLPMRVLIPYFLMAVTTLLPIILVDDVRDAPGFYLLALMNAVLYVSLFLVIILHHLRENEIGLWATWRTSFIQIGAGLALVALVATSGWMRGIESLHALSVGLEPFHLTKANFVVAGAGKPSGSIRYVFSPGWK